jgi:ubiquinone/menaquinone biosynthesis C-methylase UbiE
LTKWDRIKKTCAKLLLGFYTKDVSLFEFKGLNVLDIGIGDCEYLKRLKKLGAKTNGVEIRKDACNKGNSLGLNIFHGTLNEAKYSDNYFDFVRSNHSFEHLTDPIGELKEINRILKANGIFYVGVPNTSSIAFKIFKKYWYYLGVPFHPYSYSVENLSLLLKKNGFSVKRVVYNGNFNGLLGSIQILLNSRNKKNSEEGLFTNIFTRIIFHQIARFLNAFKMGDCIEIVAVKN